MGGPDDSSRDEVINRKEFERKGLDISSFMLVDEQPVEEEKQDENQDEKQVDEALGEILTPFVSGDSEEEVVDPRHSEAVAAEQRIHWTLMVAMIVLWTILGTYLGVVMTAGIAGPALLSMALFSLWLASKWIPDDGMRILGTTWAIIGMKLLYGLAIDLHHWGMLDSSLMSETAALGILLLGLVVLNIIFAHHFDEDAIAAQATLVLLAIGSAAGAVYGQLGVALMIGVATIILHSLALYRKSGNLTSLGVAASNLWIGLHALSTGWEILGLVILPFEDPLILLLLMLFVNVANAAVAAHFARSTNWFSSAAEVLGLGKPGLWGVSIGLGLVGALLAIASHRSETGFALAQITMLLVVFGSSYLVVRGVEPRKVLPGVLVPLPLLVVLLVLLSSGLMTIPLLSAHSAFAAGMALVAAFTLMNHQSAVSDAVIWTGGLIAALLLTLLVPSGDGQHGGILLLSLCILFTGLGGFAVKRESPSIAGTAVLAPWLWIFIFATDVENRLVSQDIIPVELDAELLAFFMFAMGLLQVGVNLTLGSTGVDLGKAFGSGTEALARIRDSGVLQLWSLGWLIALLGWLAVSRPGGMTAYGLILGFVSLAAMHVLAQIAGRHINRRRFLLLTLGAATLWANWRFGLTLVWPLLIAMVGTLLSWDAGRSESRGGFDQENRIEPLISLTFIIIALHLALASLGLQVINLLGGSEWFTDGMTVWIILVGICAMLALFLPGAGTHEKPLAPAVSCVFMLVMLMIWTQGLDGSAFLLSGAVFTGSGLWLISQGEIRLGLASVAKAETQKEEAVSRKEIADQGLRGVESPDGAETGTGVRLLDANLIHKAAVQKRRRRRSGTTGEDDLLTGDVHHVPLIVLSFMAIWTLQAAGWAFLNGAGDAILMISMLVFVAAMLLAQRRATSLEMRMPDILGIELPFAASMAGLVFIHIAGRISEQHVNPDSHLGILILVMGLCIIAWISLRGRNDLALRLPSALEWILYALVADRLLALFLVGSIPAPFALDPFAGASVEWVLPWMVLEITLIFCLLLFDMVERKRLERGLDDHRGADGRSLWAGMVMLASCGPATLLAAVLAILRARSWNQPGLALTALLLIPLAFFQTSEWVPVLDGFKGYSMLLVGLGSTILLASSIKMGTKRWSTAWLWDIHLLIPAGALVVESGVGALMVSCTLFVSGAAWVTGVLEDRRGWRVMGFLDLLAAWTLAGLAMTSGTLTAGSLLPMLLSSVILLGIVTWLGQRNAGNLSID